MSALAAMQAARKHLLGNILSSLGVLAVIMAAVYFAYILTIAFRPSLLSLPVSENAVVTWGVVVGAALLSFGFLLTAIYVVVANTRFDALSRRLQEDLP